ncbi:Uncharacterised protein [Chlamydia trachomatis]|nr:Uncharacterised protein [Chlamydia trachomatis]
MTTKTPIIEFETDLDGIPVYIRSVSDDEIRTRYNKETRDSLLETEQLLSSGKLKIIPEDVDIYIDKILKGVEEDDLV